MSKLTSEKIAKALKGAGLDSKQRIEKAYEAWNDDAVYFPNKSSFLFDWICSAFAKPNMKKLNDCCLIQLPYWNLLHELLQHYHEKGNSSLKLSIPTIHVNFVSSISILLQQLYNDPIKNTLERTEFLSIAHKCLAILFSSTFTLSYRPAFEHISTAVDQILTVLTTQIDLYFSNDNNKEQEVGALQQLALMAQILLNKYDSQLVLAANQKKIFSTLVEKSLFKLLSVRRRIGQIEAIEDAVKVSQTITDIVCHALFHADTVLEFTSVLKDASNDGLTNNVKQANYVVKLFDALENIVKEAKDSGQLLDVLEISPILFSAFLEAFRQKRNGSTSAMQDVNRMVEFGFFIYFLRILSNVKEKETFIYFRTLCQLLDQLLQWNVYTVRNDDIAKYQQSVLNEVADDIISYMNDSKRCKQCLVLDLADILLQIDFSIIENRIESLWPIMLNPEINAQESCFKFSKSVMKTYSASRQIDTFINDLLTHISYIQSENLSDLLTRPMFSKEFLNEFLDVITKHMPAAQALDIFIAFQKKLNSNAASVDNGPPRKKQKKAQPKYNQLTLKAPLITVYFVEFSKALKLSQQQHQAFEVPALSIFNEFVKPNIDAWMKFETNTENTVLPALQAHSALIDIFFEMYTSKISSEDQEWLAASYVRIFQVTQKDNTLISRTVAAICVNAMLQHVSYMSMFQPSAQDNQNCKLINIVVDFVIEDTENNKWYKDAEWNGSMLDIQDENTLKLVCWKLISDDWIEPIVQYIDSERAEKLVTIIYASIMDDLNNSNCITAQLLNKTLLQSANFYEAECFKTCNIKVVLNLFIQLFQVISSSTSSSKKISKVASEMISIMDLSNPVNLDKNSVMELSRVMRMERDAMDENTATIDVEDLKKIANLMKLLLLFPNEYYKKNERLQTLYLITLVDIWSVSFTNADVSVRNDISLMCRSLHLRFMDSFSVNSILGLDSNILDWLISFNTVRSHSLEYITNELDLNILRRIILNASVKEPEEHSVKYFKDILDQRTKDLNKDISSVSLSKLTNLLHAINLALTNRKTAKTEVDVDSNIAYAVNTISKISQFSISYVEGIKSTITEMLRENNVANQIIQENQYTFDCMKKVFHLTRLLQEYARIVGPSIDDVISAKELSKALTVLASPFIRFLQCTRLLENEVILNMTTEFIAAFCSILSRYQQVDMTKHVLASIWFVFSLVYNVDSEESAKILLDAFATWIQSLSKEQYGTLIEGFLEQAEQEATNRSDSSKEQHHLVFLILFSQLLEHCVDIEKGYLKKQISSIILKLSLIAGRTKSIKYLQQMLKVLVQLTSDQSYHFSEYDTSLILSCLLQIAHPTAPERFRGQLTRNTIDTLFADICLILSNLASQHKEQLVYMMPPYIALVQSLLHCFKATNISLINRKRKHIIEDNTIPLFAQFTPLDATSANRLARLLTTIPQKPNVQFQKKSVHMLQKMLAKHTPSLLIEYFSIQSNPTTNIVNPTIKSILTHALYDILDVCSEADRAFVLSCLDGSGKVLFKSFYMTWKETHKYTGQ